MSSSIGARVSASEWPATSTSFASPPPGSVSQGACTVLVTLVAESRLIIKAEMRLQHSTPEEHWPQVGDNLCDDEWTVIWINWLSFLEQVHRVNMTLRHHICDKAWYGDGLVASAEQTASQLTPLVLDHTIDSVPLTPRPASQ